MWYLFLCSLGLPICIDRLITKFSVKIIIYMHCNHQWFILNSFETSFTPHRPNIIDIFWITELLYWVTHPRMDEYRIPRRVLMAEVSGGRVRGRPRLGWMDGVRWPWATEEWRWRLRVNARKIERVESPGTYVTECVSRCHFGLALYSFGLLSPALVAITWRGVGCRYMMRLG